MGNRTEHEKQPSDYDPNGLPIDEKKDRENAAKGKTELAPHLKRHEDKPPQIATRDWSAERSELADVNRNRESLSQYLQSQEAANLDATEGERLQRQYKAMSDYAQVLDERLSHAQ